MNKRKISIIVATLVVLVMAFGLLAGCGLDAKFRRKVEKDGWTYEEVDRGIARGFASEFINFDEDNNVPSEGEKTTRKTKNNKKVAEALDKIKNTALITKKEGSAEYEVFYFEFEDTKSAKVYISELQKNLRKQKGKRKNYDYKVKRKGNFVIFGNVERN